MADYTKALSEVSNKNDPVLDLIYQLESSAGTNKEAYKENQYGALGGYQIRRVAYKDIQNAFPNKWKNTTFDTVAKDDTLSRQAAGDYLKVIESYYSKNNVFPTIENMLLGYHSGMGNVKKGKIGPLGIKYVRDAHTLMGFDKDRVEE